MPLSFLLHQQEDVVDDYAVDLPRGEQPVQLVEVKRTSVLDSSPPIPPPIALAPLKTAGPSSTSQQPSECIPVTSRDFLAVMDAVRTLAATSASLAPSHTALAERMACAEVTLVQTHAILLQIQSHLGLPPVIVTEPMSSPHSRFEPIGGSELSPGRETIYWDSLTYSFSELNLYLWLYKPFL